MLEESGAVLAAGEAGERPAEPAHPAGEDGHEKPSSNCVEVVVRVRPENPAELSDLSSKCIVKAEDCCVFLDPDGFTSEGISQGGLETTTPGTKRRRANQYSFDRVYGPTATQVDVFDGSVRRLLRGVLQGFNSSVFCYGATGAGKTFTMMGDDAMSIPGMIPMAVAELFRLTADAQDRQGSVELSYCEVYNEQIRDLLSPTPSPLQLREGKDAAVVHGLQWRKVESADTVLRLLADGSERRVKAATGANEASSRSHAVLQLVVRTRSATANVSTEWSTGKLSLIDLAGSERAAATENMGRRMKEGANINRSLLALGNVITALASRKPRAHVGYRDSKLTRMLKDSLGGNCRTLMVTNIAPSSRTYEDTHNALKYADRAKRITVKLHRNTTTVSEHISRYTSIIGDLRSHVAELQLQLDSEREARAAAEKALADALTKVRSPSPPAASAEVGRAAASAADAEAPVESSSALLQDLRAAGESQVEAEKAMMALEAKRQEVVLDLRRSRVSLLSWELSEDARGDRDGQEPVGIVALRESVSFMQRRLVSVGAELEKAQLHVQDVLRQQQGLRERVALLDAVHQRSAESLVKAFAQESTGVDMERWAHYYNGRELHWGQRYQELVAAWDLLNAHAERTLRAGAVTDEFRKGLAAARGMRSVSDTVDRDDPTAPGKETGAPVSELTLDALRRAKDDAVAREDFDEARHLKAEIHYRERTPEETPARAPSADPPPVPSTPRPVGINALQRPRRVRPPRTLQSNLEALERRYAEFCEFGGRRGLRQMDGNTFAKLCKDCKLVDRSMSTTDGDLIFARVKLRGHRTIDFSAFHSIAVPEIAKKRGTSVSAVIQLILQGAAVTSGTTRGSAPALAAVGEGRVSSATPSRPRGPTSVSRSSTVPSGPLPRARSSTVCPAGAQASAAPPAGSARRMSPRQQAVEVPRSPAHRSGTGGGGGGGFVPRHRSATAVPHSSASHDADAATLPADTVARLEERFTEFCEFGVRKGSSKGEMDNKTFVKLCRDCRLTDPRGFPEADVDLLFARIRPKEKRTIDFGTFRNSVIPEIARRRDRSVETVVGLLLSHSAVLATSVREEEGASPAYMRGTVSSSAWTRRDRDLVSLSPAADDSGSSRPGRRSSAASGGAEEETSPVSARPVVPRLKIAPQAETTADPTAFVAGSVPSFRRPTQSSSLRFAPDPEAAADSARASDAPRPRQRSLKLPPGAELRSGSPQEVPAGSNRLSLEERRFQWKTELQMHARKVIERQAAEARKGVGSSPLPAEEGSPQSRDTATSACASSPAGRVTSGAHSPALQTLQELGMQNPQRSNSGSPDDMAAIMQKL